MTIDEKRENLRKYCESQEICGDCVLCDSGCYGWYEDGGSDSDVERCYSIMYNSNVQNQTAKADAGKPKLTLVPQQILYDIAEVREYGCKKYHNPDNWKNVEKERYRDAAFRHFLAYLREPNGVDEESGIEHLKHLAANIAFLCELEKESE